MGHVQAPRQGGVQKLANSVYSVPMFSRSSMAQCRLGTMETPRAFKSQNRPLRGLAVDEMWSYTCTAASPAVPRKDQPGLSRA